LIHSLNIGKFYNNTFDLSTNIAQQVSASSEEIAASAEKMSSNSDEVTSNIHELSNMSKLMMKEVNKFELK